MCVEWEQGDEGFRYQHWMGVRSWVLTVTALALTGFRLSFVFGFDPWFGVWIGLGCIASLCIGIRIRISIGSGIRIRIVIGFRMCIDWYWIRHCMETAPGRAPNWALMGGFHMRPNSGVSA